MSKIATYSGYSNNNLPYIRIGSGERIIVIFDGLDFTHNPPHSMGLTMYGYIKQLVTAGYTVYQVRRKPGLPDGYSMKDMADDYAVMIKEEMKYPVDIMGLSTGGSIAFYFAADHPGLVRRLIFASSGYKLNEKGKALQLEVAALARAGKLGAASSKLMEGVLSGFSLFFAKIMTRLFAGAMFPGGKTSDGIIEIEAEDKHNFKDRLAEINCPTLVIGGDSDFFYGPLEDTASGIPGAKLVLYKNAGHGAIMKKEFTADILAFLQV
jgi:pimeloyl-ACP methyl ester carboxylesterase